MLHWLLIVLTSLFHTHQSNYTRTVDRVSASIVRITAEKDVMTPFGPQHVHGVCSGIVIAEGWVLTAQHCLGDPMDADGSKVSTIESDERYDLALLSLTTHKPVLLLRDSPVVRFEDLTAIGYAWGLRRLSVLHVQSFLLDVSPAENIAPGMIVQGGYVGGMSGGPVVDANGYMVGIIQQANDGIGYGVGIQIIRVFLLGVNQ